jgi:hypothetical protein
MRPDAPFTDLLEAALSVPDFDLGDDLRMSLLAAADEVSPPQVIELVTAESWDVSAFNWLLGEQASDPELMDWLVGNAAFTEAVAGQQKFLRKLSTALRPPVMVVAPVRGPSFHRMQALALAVTGLAAVITWLWVVLMPVGSVRVSQGVAAVSAPEQAATVYVKQASSDSRPLATSVRSVAGFAELPQCRDEAETVAQVSNLEAVRGGAGVLKFDEATRLAAKELFQGRGEAFGVELVSAEPHIEALIALNAARPGVGLSFGSSDGWTFNRGLLSADKSSFPGLGESLVPEPSGLLLVALGGLILLGKRERRAQTI